MKKNNRALILLVLGSLIITISVFFSGDIKLTKMVEKIFSNEKLIETLFTLEFGVAIKEDKQIQSTTVQAPNTVVESHFTPPNIIPENEKPLSEITIKGTNANEYNNIAIKNETGVNLSVKDMIEKPHKPPMKGTGPKVLLVHTHGSESYTPTGKNSYSPSDNDRTLDKNYNMIRIGNEVEAVLNKAGIGTVHIEEIFDSPTYTGSYDRSLEAITKAMKANPSIEIVVDLHRDAMITKTGTKYKAVTEVNGKKTAQLMFVMGTDLGGLVHNDWKKNLNMAVNLQNNLSKKYSGLMRPILLRKQRFNQHVTNASILVEVGTSGNTLEEAILGAKLFAGELIAYIKS